MLEMTERWKEHIPNVCAFFPSIPCANSCVQETECVAGNETQARKENAWKSLAQCET